MSTDLVEFLQFAGAVLFVVPVAFFGVLKLLAGEALVAGAFFALAGVMFYGREYVTSPRDLPVAALDRVLGRVAKEPEDEE